MCGALPSGATAKAVSPGERRVEAVRTACGRLSAFAFPELRKFGLASRGPVSALVTSKLLPIAEHAVGMSVVSASWAVAVTICQGHHLVTFGAGGLLRIHGMALPLAWCVRHHSPGTSDMISDSKLLSQNMVIMTTEPASYMGLTRV